MTRSTVTSTGVCVVAIALALSLTSLPAATQTTATADERIVESDVNFFYGAALTALADGKYDRAVEMSQKALELGGRVWPDDPSIKSTLQTVAGRAHLRAGDYPAAKADLNDALAALETTLGAGHPDLAGVLEAQADLYRHMGRAEEALGVAERAFALRQAASPPDPANVENAAALYGIALVDAGSPFDALDLLAGAVDAYAALPSPDPVRQVRIFNDYAIALYATGQPGPAADAAVQGADFAAQVLGERHPMRAEALNTYAASLAALGDIQAAAQWYVEAIEIRSEALGLDHPDLATTLNNYGTEQVDFFMADADYKQIFTNAETVVSDYWVPCTPRGRRKLTWRRTPVARFVSSAMSRLVGLPMPGAVKWRLRRLVAD